MKLVVDNCLPLSWAGFLRQRGHTASHWRDVGSANATDAEIMRWAREQGAVVLTHDLDFTKLLFQARTALPSVIQLRVDDVRPAGMLLGFLLRYRLGVECSPKNNCGQAVSQSWVRLPGGRTRTERWVSPNRPAARSRRLGIPAAAGSRTQHGSE